MEHIIDIVDEVCQKWNKDLPPIPIPAQVHECYHYEIKNTRRKMEDRHVMLPDLNTLFDLKVCILDNQSVHRDFPQHQCMQTNIKSSLPILLYL